MFNMQKIGRRISSLRREHNMTQVELADKLSISFQAVSNWERGNSMPDITKLPELADIFNVSVDELLGERSALVEAAVNNNIAESFDNNQISRDEIVNALPILNTLQMDIVIEKSCNSNPANIDIFLPYMSESDVKELAEKSIERGETVDEYLPFMDESDVKELAEKSIERGETVDEYLPFMDESDVKELAEKSIEKGEAVDKYLPFMDESDVKELAEKSIERGEAVDKYLPFMNEIDVKELALKFLELKS